MSRARQRLLLLLGAVPVLLLLSTFAYMAGMRWLEGEPRDFLKSLTWASETLSTTGFGADSSWRHPLMVLLVVTVQWIGVFLVFLIVPVFLIPFLEDRFEARIPRRVTDLKRHVVIYRSGPAVATLLPQLAALDVPTLVVETDEAEARRLLDKGQRVILAELDPQGLADAQLEQARALIANGSDAENAAVILAARQAGFTGEVLALAEDPFHRRPLTLAGASGVFTPRHALGAALAARASAKISPRAAGLEGFSKSFQLSEVRVRPSSELAGKRLKESGIGRRTGAAVVGQWVGGHLQTPVEPATVIAPGGILVAAGSEESLARLRELATAGAAPAPTGPFLVAGFGEVGRKVVELLRIVEEPVEIVDKVPHDGVERVGDVLDARVVPPELLRQARGVILALDSDSATLFAAVVVREHAPDVPLIARVNQAENVERIHRAGADFALSISQVSGQILARRLLGQEAVWLDPRVELLKVPVDGLEGQHPAELDLRRETGCWVVAVERGEELAVEFDHDFRFAPGDQLYVTGASEAVAKFRATARNAAG